MRKIIIFKFIIVKVMGEDARPYSEKQTMYLVILDLILIKLGILFFNLNY